MTETILYPDTPFDLQRSLVLLCRRGSESHGTFVPSTDPNSIDDRDLYGVCIPPSDYYLGLKSWEHAESIKEVWDVVLDEYKKYVGLLLKQNPNVVGSLWLEKEDYLVCGPSVQTLIENRNRLRSRTLAYKSFSGYAYGQMKKMTSGEFKGFMGAKRKKLVEKYGFDCKNAAHLIRLLHMGIEYLETGELKVRRTWDKDMILDIKQGKWSLDAVQNYATECFAKCDIAYKDSDLPEQIDFEFVNDTVSDELIGHLTGD